MTSFSDGGVPDGCPSCGGNANAVAYRGTYRSVYPGWRRSDTLAVFDQYAQVQYVCTNCGAVKTEGEA